MSKFKLNADQKAWIHDLLTTTEPQTIGALERIHPNGPKRPNGFCCLGRACIALGLPRKASTGSVVWFGSLDDDRDTFLPREACDRLNMSYDGVFKNKIGVVVIRGKKLLWVKNKKDIRAKDVVVDRLTDANDTGKVSFKEIGKFIQAHPGLVFGQ